MMDLNVVRQRDASASARALFISLQQVRNVRPQNQAMNEKRLKTTIHYKPIGIYRPMVVV